MKHTGPFFSNISIPTVYEVLRLIKLMPAKSSPVDSIPTSVVKNCPEVFAELIARLLSLSLAEGKFPDAYEQALATPLLKKEGLDGDSFVNYRQISNLHTISKIVELLFMTRLIQHVQQSPDGKPSSSSSSRHIENIILPKQLNDVYSAADKGARTALVQLDLSAALDIFDIGNLLRRLRYTFGVSGLALN